MLKKESQIINRPTAIMAAMFLVLVLTGATPTGGTRETILIRTGDVSTHTDPDTTLGPYYTVSYALPEGLTSNRLDRAMVELYVDVRARPREGFVNPSPLLEVYALNEPHAGSFDPGRLEPEGRAVRPVAVGSGRRVILDVTGIVRAHLEGRMENHGLMVGSLTGERDGAFTILSGRLPEQAVGRFLIFKCVEIGGQS